MADQDMPTFDELAQDLSGIADGNSDVKDEAETTAPAESSTEENKESDGGESTEAEAPADTEDAPDQQSEEETEAEADEEQTPPTPADQRKDQLNAEIRDLVAQRNAIRQEVSQLTAQAYQPRSPQEIMEQDGQDAVNARLQAVEEQQAFERWNTQVSETRLVLTSESDKVLQDFPMFNPSSPNFNQQLAQQAASLLEQGLIRDPNVPEVGPDGRPTGLGMVIGSNTSPYQLYKTISDAHTLNANQSRIEGQVNGQRAAEQMLASAEPNGSASETTKEEKEDPFFVGLTKKLNG